MAKPREMILASTAVLLAIACSFAVYGFLVPTFTDHQIEESLSDTWEVSAIFTIASLAIVLLTGLVSVALGWRGSRSAKRLSIVSVALSLLTAVLLVSSHATLTERASKLTGQEFGGAFDLGLF
jgi:uncharacterized membrane protein